MGVSLDYPHFAVREPEAQRREAAHLRSSSQEVSAPVLEHGSLSVLFSRLHGVESSGPSDEETKAYRLEVTCRPTAKLFNHVKLCKVEDYRKMAPWAKLGSGGRVPWLGIPALSKANHIPALSLSFHL